MKAARKGRKPKPGRKQQRFSAYDSSIEMLKQKALQMGLVRNGKGDAGQLIDLIAQGLSENDPQGEILDAILARNS